MTLVPILAQSASVLRPNHSSLFELPAPTYCRSPERSVSVSTQPLFWYGAQAERVPDRAPSSSTEAKELHAVLPLPWEKPRPSSVMRFEVAEARVTETGLAAPWTGTRTA